MIAYLYQWLSDPVWLHKQVCARVPTGSVIASNNQSFFQKFGIFWMPHEGQAGVENESQVAFSHAEKMGVEIRAGDIEKCKNSSTHDANPASCLWQTVTTICASLSEVALGPSVRLQRRSLVTESSTGEMTLLL